MSRSTRRSSRRERVLACCTSHGQNIARGYPLPEKQSNLLCDVIPRAIRCNAVRIYATIGVFRYRETRTSPYADARGEKLGRCSRVRKRGKGSAKRVKGGWWLICETPTAGLTLAIIFHRYAIFPSFLSLSLSLYLFSLPPYNLHLRPRER